MFDSGTVTMLDDVRVSILEGIYKDKLWGDSDLALSDILLRREDPAPTRTVPMDEDISAGKNTYTYDAHT